MMNFEKREAAKLLDEALTRSLEDLKNGNVETKTVTIHPKKGAAALMSDEEYYAAQKKALKEKGIVGQSAHTIIMDEGEDTL